MNSMNYLGRIVSNFKEFYNEINAATLTGAIDVVVVEQADGTFTCSPFHVRFGKLGVLRSREKVVDIEINGEPQDIHMKLGDSGEAFFVEEISNADIENIPEHLATSPIPVSEFEKLYNADEKPRRKSIDLGYEQTFENQVSDYKTRRYTDSHQQDYSIKKKEFVQRQINLGNIPVEHSIEDLTEKKQSDDDQNQDEIFKMDSLDSDLPKPILKKELKLELKVDDDKIDLDNNKSGKKKRRKKSSMKKKNSQRKTSTVNTESVPIEQDIDSKLTESTDKSSLGSSHSEHDLITSSDAPTGSRLNRDSDFLFFSDTELTANNSNHNSRPNTPVQSDTEFEVSQRKVNDDQPAGQSWAWGQLPITPNHSDLANITDQNNPESEVKQAERYSMLSTMFSFMKQHKRMRHNSSSEGMYLADLSSGTLDPAVTALYFPNNKTKKKSDADIDCESGNGPSLPQSPNSIEGTKSLDSDYEDHPRSHSVKRALQDISLSLCGWGESPNEDNFVRHVVSFTDLCNNPALLESPDLVVRIGDKYYSYRAAMPIIISMLVYQRQLPQSTIEQLCSMHMPNANVPPQTMQKQEPRSYSWWSWRRRTTETTGANNEVKIEEIKEELNITDETPTTPKDVQVNMNDSFADKEEGYVGSQGSSDEGETSKKNTSTEMTYGEKFIKTLRLTSEQIKKLNLHEGMNEVEFSVTTAYQGTTRCKCHIYRWRYDDKVVISDIDGTITKSDVLGHILPIVGKDWAQSGVAQLFTKIKNNGYKLLYLSARAIGQARVTREYLRSIKQGDLSLPDGPLLLNPTSLISAFHREVIEKKPEQFKISCLSDIQALFPPDSNPFYAGYGNRINDVWAYRAVGIPIVRIFTINHKGELKHELTQTFQSSYSSMTSFVDQLFPPQLEDANAFSQFVYWREPITPVDDIEKLF